MKRPPLERLLELRRRREARALEALTLRKGAHRRAQAHAEEARDAVLRHTAHAKEQERALMASLMGQNIRHAAIARLQASLDVLAIEQKDLCRHESEAKAELKERRKDLDKARKAYRERHKDAEKFGELVQLQSARTARRQIALDEAIQDDQSGLRPRQAHLL